MSDIIKDAKQLLDAATRGPWAVYTRSFGVIDAIGPIERDLTEGLDVDSGSAELAVAAPELAQALAEETYFYGVQVWMGGWWIMMLTSNYGTSLMHRGKWFEHKHEAEECAAKWNHDTPTRIVRQRRSLVEDWTANDD